VLLPGDIIVSNFNNSSNLQGTGTTIMRITSGGTASVFFQGSTTPGALGLTTALGLLKRGFVVVGSLPTLDGTSATIQAPGSLVFLDRYGNSVETLVDSSLLDGPWDLTVNDQGATAQIFVANVLSGTVTRLDLSVPTQGAPVVLDKIQIASGYATALDPVALVLGPTGVAYDSASDTLYVASTKDNTVFAVANAGTRTTDGGTGAIAYQDAAHLRGPLGLTLTPNGDLIVTNGDAVNGDPNFPSEMVEFVPATVGNPSGTFVDQVSVDTGGQGGAFGLAVDVRGSQLRLAAVDDVVNTLEVWTIKHFRSAPTTSGNSANSAANLPSAIIGSVLAGSGNATADLFHPASASTGILGQSSGSAVSTQGSEFHPAAVDALASTLELGTTRNSDSTPLDEPVFAVLVGRPSDT
jgi:hypothetical protein